VANPHRLWKNANLRKADIGRARVGEPLDTKTVVGEVTFLKSVRKGDCGHDT